MLRNKIVTSKSGVVSKMNRIKIDTKRVECIMHDTSLASLSIGIQNIRRVSDTMICTPFTGQTSKGGIYYALLIRIQNEMCRIISTRNMG